jgi:hypothetical protein
MKFFTENEKGNKTFENGTILTDSQIVRLIDNAEAFESHVKSIRKQIVKAETFAYTINMTNCRDSKPATDKDRRIEKANTKTTKVTTISEFVELVVNQKRTWSPYIFDGFGLKKENSIFSQIIALDFDCGIDYKTVLELCTTYEVEPTFMYTSFSHTEEHHKFRAIWFLLDLIPLTNDNYPFQSNLAQFKYAEKTLAKFIDKALSHLIKDKEKHPTVYDDKCVGDIQRCFYSGNKILHLNEDNLYTDYDFIYLLGAPAITNDDNRTRNIGTFLEVKNEMFNGCEYLQQSQFSFEELAQRFKIFNDFVNCKWLSWGVLRGIASNIAYFEGGCKFFLQKVEEIQQKGISNYNSGEFDNVKNLSKFSNKIRTEGWFPESLNKFSPYEEDHQYNNMTEKIRKNNVIIPKYTQNDDTIKYNHTEAIANAKQETYNFFDDIGNRKYTQKIIIYVGYCGIGKTHTGMAFAANSYKNFNIKTSVSFKRYNVIEEKYNLTQSCADFAGSEFIKQPKMPNFSYVLNQKIARLYAEKEFMQVSELIRDVANTAKSKNAKYDYKDIDLAMEYQTLIDAFEDADRSIYKNYTPLCTHKRTINKPLSADVLIVDECIEPACYNQTEVNFDVLTNFKSNLDIKYQSEYQMLLDNMKNLLINSKSYTDKFDIKFKKVLAKCKTYCKANKLRNLYELFNCDCFTIYEAVIDNVSKIKIIGSWYKVPRLSEEQQMVVLSATPNIDFYISQYGVENVLIVEQKTNVKFGATVYQNNNYSYAKSSLLKDGGSDETKDKQAKRLENLNNCLKQYKNTDKPILVTYKDFMTNKKFKQFGDTFNNHNVETDINGETYYFGNLDGMDGAKHKSMLVFGTYSNNPDALKRKCILLYPNVNIDAINADKTTKQECSDIDFERFMYNTYTVPELRTQHLYFTRDAQVQALYRSRPLTADKSCKVFMLSKYPIKGAVIFNRF